jgi:heme exporter protein D
MSEFFSMGGYAGYVWSAYGITLAVLVLNVWLALRRRRIALQRARIAAADQAPRRQPTVRQVQ